MAKFYKILGPNGESCYGGKGTWHLPKRKRPGKWMPKLKGELVPCKHGYHLLRRKDVMYWLHQQHWCDVLIATVTIWVTEARGETVRKAAWAGCGGKSLARQARLVRQLTWNRDIARAIDTYSLSHRRAAATRCLFDYLYGRRKA